MVHCLTMGGEHSEVTHIQLLKDCAELCKLSESFMLRGSDFAEELCKLCADICEQCADNCEKVGPEDAQMGECAQLCRKCAESCRAI